MSLAASLTVLALLLLPPGLVVLRWAGLRLDSGRQLGLALAIGGVAAASARWLEGLAGAPLAVPLAAVCAIGLLRSPPRRPDWRALGGRLALPLCLAALALSVSAPDLRRAADGATSFRVGFDVSDRAIYALFAEEFRRSPPPTAQNPLFAGAPSGYSFFPSLLGLLLHEYAGVPVLDVFLAYAPALSLLLLGLCLGGLLEEMGVVGCRARGVTLLVVALGGDLSWLFDARNATALERTSGFLVFHSFAAESLFYNPWALGAAFAFAGLQLALRWLRTGSSRDLVLAATLFGGLWQAKVFACLALLAGAWIAALASRERRLAALALAASAATLPWAVLTAFGGAGTLPLAPYGLMPVRAAAQAIDALEPVARLVAGGSGWAWPALVALLPAFLLGSLGVRVVGLPRLFLLLRGPDSAFHRLVACAIGAGLLLGLCTVGRPVTTDGAQFLTLPLYLLWLYAGPALAATLSRGGLTRAVGLTLLAAALVGPVRYLALKAFPEALTPPASWDRAYLTLPPQVGAACAWLRATPATGAALLMPLAGDPGDVGGLKPLYAAALCQRRLAAYALDFGVEPALGAERRRASAIVYATREPALGERALEALGAHWVWDEPGRPVAFSSPRLVRRYDSGGVRIFEFRREGAGGAR